MDKKNINKDEEKNLDLNNLDDDSIKNVTDDSKPIPEDETESEEGDEDEIDIMFKFSTNNHKIEGKHSLKRDTIFKGKVEDEEGEEFYSYATEDYKSQTDGFPIEAGSMYEFESKHNDQYINNLSLSNDVYNLLKEKTDLDFSSNRRKPNRQAFNDYYRMLLDILSKKYSKSEIFVELSYYFTDNIFNMFKLLDKEYATQIIFELKQAGYLDNLNNINFI